MGAYALKPGEHSPRHDFRRCQNAKVRAPLSLCALTYWIGIACRNVEALFRPLPVDGQEEKAILRGIRQNIGLGDAIQ